MIKKSYANGTSDKALLGETICQNLSNTVKLFPDREALISPYQNYHATYSEFWKEVEIAAKAFIAAGIKKGDRIGIWSPNRYEWVIVQYATARMGAILVTVNPAYRAEELKFALKQSEISLLVMSKNFRKTNYIKILDQVKDECPDLKRVVNLDIDWQQFLNESEDVTDQELQDRINELQFDDPINIQYTSGTTGYPKAATLTHHRGAPSHASLRHSQTPLQDFQEPETSARTHQSAKSPPRH
jgi:fatty-acyl-CoA synthase